MAVGAGACAAAAAWAVDLAVIDAHHTVPKVADLLKSIFGEVHVVLVSAAPV